MSISNVVALNRVVETCATAGFDDVVQAINIKLGLSVRSDNDSIRRREKAESLRVEAGQMLVDLRRRVEAEFGNVWWKWQSGKFTRGRKDIEKVMRLAKSDDPEAAAEKERSDRNERRTRNSENDSNTDGAARRSNSEPAAPRAADPPTPVLVSIVENAMCLVRQMTTPQRHEFMAKLKEEFQ